MKYSLKQYAQSLYEAFQETKDKDHDKIIANFVEILKSNGDLAYYEKIINEFEIYQRKAKGIKEVEVTAAKEGVVNDKLIHELNKIVGKDIVLKQKVDDSLVGGVTIKVEDTLIDASVKNQLNNLRNDLVNS